MAQLFCIAGDDVGRRWNVPEGEVLVGRDPACDVVLTDGRVSRRHCRISFAAGYYVIANLSQTNGTQVNKTQITEQKLEDRDEIELGNTALRFLLQDASIPAAHPAPGTAPAAPPSPPRPLDIEKSVVFYGAEENAAGTSHDLIRAAVSQTALDPSDISRDLSLPDQLQSYARRFEIVRSVVDSIVTELDLERIFSGILDHVFNFVAAERGCVMTVNPANGECVVQAVLDRSGQRRLKSEFPMSRTICEQVLRDKVAVLSTNAMADARFSGHESIVLRGIRSVMSAPMVFHDETLGIISVDNSGLANAFSKKDLETLSTIASLGATAIHNANMVKQHVRMEMTRESFARFLPPALVRQVTEEGRELRLGGEQADVTVLFADIRSFTPICANRPPQEVVHLLNTFFHELTEVIFRHRGTLDKYIGDCIMAIFGCPEPYPHHSLRAARAALDMRRVLTTHPLLSKEIRVGIGLHRGLVIHGFVGSKQRMQYTAVGDTVNIAARLCDAAEGGQIIISPSVHYFERDYLATKSLGPLDLQGVKERLVCHELLDLTESGRTYNPWD